MLNRQSFNAAVILKQQGDILCFMALGLLAVNFVAPTIALFFSCTLAGYIIWKADLHYFPALVLLHFSARNFLLQDFGNEDFAFDTLEFVYIRIAGFPVTVGNIIAIVMTLRWAYAGIAERDPVLKQHPRMIWLWILALPVAVVITYIGFTKNLMNPTQAVRGLLGFGVFFYGMRLAKSWSVARWYCVDRLLLIMGVTCLLGLFGRCGTNFFFFSLALGPVLAIVRLKTPLSVNSKIVAVFAILTTVGYALRGQPGTGLITSTLTSMGQGVLSLMIGVFMIRKTRAGLFFKSFWLAVLVCLLFTSYAVMVAEKADAENVKEGALAERIQFKIFGDRAPLWKRTWDKICSPPYVIREYVPFIGEGGKEQKYGAHNLYLQTLDVHGWWAGGIYILLIWITMLLAEKGVRRGQDILIKGVYGGLYVVCSIGMTTGHSAGGGDYLFLWGLLAGVCIGFPVYEKINSARYHGVAGLADRVV